MEKFKQQVILMETSFKSDWASDSSLNQFFFEYEKNVLSDHLLSLNQANKGLITRSGDKPFTANNVTQSESAWDSSQYILFENASKQHLKKELNDLPNLMENPFQILKRFIKWEMMDLEAIIETIDSKNEMSKRKHLIATTKEKN